MERILIYGFPLEMEVISGERYLLDCIDKINSKVSILIRWKFIEDKLVISFDVDNSFASKCILNYLNLNKYQFKKISYNDKEIGDDIDYTKLSWALKFSNSRESLAKPQFFNVISYLKQEKCELNCWIYKTDTSKYSYKLFCSYEGRGIIPSPIVSSFSLSNYWEYGIPDFITLDDSASLSPLFSLPIAYDGMKDLLYGYGGNTAACMDQEQAIVVGKINNHSLGYYLTLQPKAFSYMTSIWGVPGGGKTVLSLSLVTQLWNKFSIPSLIIEPSKHEYRALANVLNGGINLLKDLKKINVLIPPKGVDIYAWSEVIVMLINMACQIPNDSPLSGYYRRAYIMAASYNSEKPVTPVGMITCFMLILQQENYTGVQARDFIKAGTSRLEAFFSYFNGSEKNWHVKEQDLALNSLNIEELFKKTTIIELASITTPKLKSAYVYLILQHVYAYIQQRHSEADKLENLLLLEEAHNILRTTSNEEVLNNVSNILAEARALKMGVVISDQSPKVLDPACVSMAQNVFSFKIVNQEDREIITHATNGNIEKLLDLPRGICLTRTHFMHDAEYVTVEVKDDFLNKITDKAKEENIRYLYE